MKKLFQFLTLLFFITFNVISSAEDTNLYGYLTCGAFLDSCDKSKLEIDCQAQTFWALGYVSSKTYSQSIYISTNIFNDDNMKYALIQYCKENPFKDTHDGAENIFYQIK